MSKKIKMITTILLIVFTLCSIASIVLADDYAPSNYPGAKGNMNTSKITTAGGQIIYIVRIVGSMAAVAILVVLGIKYMMGSTEEKAEYKKTMLPYIIGAFMVFGATWIGTAIYTAAQNFGS